MARELLVFGDKTFRISVPDDSKITFGPFSPPTSSEAKYGGQRAGGVGTLRIYGKTKEHVIAVFAGVRGFRDLSLEYMEEVAVEEGARIWKSDEAGYVREEKVSGSRKWVSPVPAIEAGEAQVEEVEEAPF